MDNHASQSLMIQGTTSDAGKTTLVAGLCRLYARAGLAIAPFKPQNMALNSAVTVDGGEIGRSQALQAYAAGVDAHSDMNPVLLKPNSDTGAQVIIQGQAKFNLEAGRYHDYKPQAMVAALDSYQRLQGQFPLIFVEGAGSPAEINLRQGDIANMGFAEAADCPVILMADIDRGGVFAHLVGTLDLLSSSEQARVKGFVINRFRGDIKLLESGLDWLEEKTGKPVLAVLPYLHHLRLDAEDAIDQQQSDASGRQLTIKIPVFPRISNHTDFDSLRLHPQVNLVYVGQDDTLEGADLIILPGSKSVQSDLAWFKRQGYDRELQRHLRYGGKVLGICGGFQMLGESISDPLGIESPVTANSNPDHREAVSRGLGYLEMSTELRPNKQLHQRRGQLHLNQFSCSVSGYEIHCGLSRGSALDYPLVTLDTDDSSNGMTDGAVSGDDQVAGTYLHGLLDQSDSLQALLQWAGLTEAQPLDRQAIRDADLDRLADSLAEHIDWPTFTQVTGLPSPFAVELAE